MTSSRQRLKMAHQILDKQLESTSSQPIHPISKTSVGKQEISEIEKKLMLLEQKMGEIECSSEDDDEDDAIIKQLNKSREKDRNRNPAILPRLSHKKYDLESEEDSENDNEIFTKIQKKLIEEPQKRMHVPPFAKNVQSNKSLSNLRKNNRSELKQSVKSVKSRKSNTSVNSKKSRRSSAISSGRKMVRSNSRKSLGSQRSGIDTSALRQSDLQIAKEAKKMSNLEKQLNHYKRLCRKQQQKLQEYRTMQIEFRKLQTNFSKSEQIRKQQKKIIESLKSKH